MPILPKAWQQPLIATTENIVRQYRRGYAGALRSDAAREKFLDSCTFKSGEDVCREFKYEESAKGELVLPYVHVEKAYPGCLPGGGQLEGDCVSWGQRCANLITMVTDAILGLPDEVTGIIEGLPEVSETARKYGVLSTEAIYWFRTTKPGHGWFCHEGAQVSRTKAGLVLRKNYGTIDLERYTKDTCNWANRREVPPELAEQFDDHLVREATEIKSFEALRDLMARGFGVQSCGSEGFASQRDEWCVARLVETWFHSMGYLGVDDRPEVHKKYGQPLVYVNNSWREWAKGPLTIHGTDFKLPPGAFGARWNDVKKRQMIVMAGANGWARPKITDYLPGWN